MGDMEKSQLKPTKSSVSIIYPIDICGIMKSVTQALRGAPSKCYYEKYIVPMK